MPTKFIIKMKKLKLLLLVFVSVAFFACKDESGEFARLILSDNEIEQGIKDCLNVSLDSANAHLAVPNGFYQYNKNAYRIHFPVSVEKIIDTLTEYGHREWIDSLIICVNRMAEANGSVYKVQIGSLIKNTTFHSPKTIINGANNAATEYFKSMQLLPLIDILKPILAASMETFDVNRRWHEIITFYASYDSTPFIFDFQYDITRQIIENIIAEMAIEEKLIRQQESHRTTDILKKVFGN